MKTADSRVSLSFCATLVVLEVNVGISATLYHGNLTNSEPVSTGLESESGPDGKSENRENSKG